MTTTLLFNADIHCMDEARTVADAIVFGEGVIQFVGAAAEARSWLRQTEAEYTEIDGEGACVLPGFIDAHLHPMLMSVYEHSVDLNGVACLDEVGRLIDDKMGTVRDDQWVLGLQLDERLLATGCLPDRHTLDRLCPDKPLVIVKRDGHSIAVNSLVLTLAGLDDSPQPVAGGTIEIDDAGKPTGIFRENAVALVMAHFVPPDAEQLFTGAQRAFAKLASHGITSIGAILQTDSEGPGGASSEHEFLTMSALAAASPFSIYSILIGRQPLRLKDFDQSALNSPALGHKVRAFKIFADGTLGSCTACMHQGFFDHPEKAGYLTLEVGEIYRRMVEAHRRGWQICIHAIGDKAVDTCVMLYERLLDSYPEQDHRHRIEHASVVDPRSLAKIADLKLVICCQPLFIRSEKPWLAQRLGPERVGMTYPFKSFMEAGVMIAGSSDAPIEDSSVLAAIECCVTRDGFMTDECLSVDQAIALYTRNAAYAQFEEHEKGSLEVGKRADMVVLDQNPYVVAPTGIGTIRVMKTICAGGESYSRTTTA